MKTNETAGEGMRSSRRTPPAARNAMDHDRPETQRIYRYWVELHDLRDGFTRTLPLRDLRLVHLSGKRGDPPQPDEQRLRLQDDTRTIEARDLDELAAQLRSTYPDSTHERRLHWQRDLEAEQRYEDALDSLIDLVVDAAVNKLLREHEAEERAAART